MATPTSTAPPSSITTPPPNQPKPTNPNPNQPSHDPPDLHYLIKTHYPCRSPPPIKTHKPRRSKLTNHANLHCSTISTHSINHHAKPEPTIAPIHVTAVNQRERKQATSPSSARLICNEKEDKQWERWLAVGW